MKGRAQAVPAGKTRGPRERLDLALVGRGLATTRSQAQGLVLAGVVRLNGQAVSSAAQPVTGADLLEVEGRRFVGRGALKLTAALDHFGMDPSGWACADVGASTGGFTEVLLERGAERVYAIDVGYGQLAWQLRQDPRVKVMERTNARNLTSLPEPVKLAVVDVSFISLRLVLPAVRRWLAPGGEVVALAKPQFEAGRGKVGKGGVIRSPEQRQAVLDELWSHLEGAGWQDRGRVDSPVRGAAGNLEQLWRLAPDAVEADASR